MATRILWSLLAFGLAGVMAFADPPIHSGGPLGISRWAVPSDTGRYVGYYVGGGCVFNRRADPPAPDDGTWGWDFEGGFLRRRIVLGWWHGRRYQGGTGAYKTDGPKLQRPLENSNHHE